MDNLIKLDLGIWHYLSLSRFQITYVGDMIGDSVLLLKEIIAMFRMLISAM